MTPSWQVENLLSFLAGALCLNIYLKNKTNIILPRKLCYVKRRMCVEILVESAKLSHFVKVTAIYFGCS